MGRGIACDIVGEPPRSAGRSDSPPGCTRYVALHPLRGTAPVMSHCTRYVALHPLRRAAPVTWHCPRYVALHPLRGTTPDQNGCIAYGSGALPTDRVHRTTLEHTTEDSAAPARITHGQELTKPQEPRAPPATTGHGLTRNTSQPTGRARKPHPRHNEAATGFPATASSRSAALSEAPPIRRSCPRGPRPRRGQPRGGRRGRGTASRTRSPGPRYGRSGSTAGRHRARRTRRA